MALRLGLNSKQLSHMRAAAEALMPDTCQLQTVTRTADGAGGWTESWSVSATVACRVDAMISRNRSEAQAAREAKIVYYTLTVPWDTTLELDMRVVHGGVTYEVVEAHGDDSWPVTRRARLAVVK